MRSRRALAVGVGAVLLGMPVSGASSSGTASERQARAWPERLVLRVGPAVSSQVIGSDFLYALVSETTTPIRGPYRLERTSLRTGEVRRGSRFRVGSLAVASGRLWVSGLAGGQPHTVEVDPRRLTPIRSLRLPRGRVFAPAPVVAGGPGNSIWIGSSRSLLRVDAATGAALARAKVPAGFAVADVAVDSRGRHLYVSLARVVRGGLAGAAVCEYDVRSGARLAATTRGLITYSVAGAALTAVPGGVWASFRTGMLGLTVHLRQRDLALIAPPGPRVAQGAANGLFHWPMGASTTYGGGALWLANQAGIVACLDSQSGSTRALERVAPGRAIDLLAVDRASRTLLTLEARGIVRVLAPASCWG